MENLVKEAYRKIAPYANARDKTLHVRVVSSVKDARVKDNGKEVTIYVPTFWHETVYQNEISHVEWNFVLSAHEVFENEDFAVYKASWIHEGVGAKVKHGYIAVTEGATCSGSTPEGAMAQAIADAKVLLGQ